MAAAGDDERGESGGTSGDLVELIVPACEVRVGDEVLVRGRYWEVSKVRRAQGRRPPTGYNLHLLTDDRMVRAHSTAEIAIRRRAATDD